MGRAHLPHSLLRAYNNVVRLARVCQNRCHYWTCTLRFCLSDIAACQVHPYTGCVCVLSGINRLVIYFCIQVVPYQLVRLLFLFSVRVFFYIHWRFTGQQGKGEVHVLLLSTNSTRSRTFSHLFGTLHMRWLPCIFNRIACNCQATQWLIDW